MFKVQVKLGKMIKKECKDDIVQVHYETVKEVIQDDYNRIKYEPKLKPDVAGKRG